MQKLLISLTALALLTGCGTQVGVSPVTSRTQALEAQSITSLRSLETSVRTHFRTVFEALDGNHDGALVADETRAAGLNDDGFGRADANQDGKINVTEFLAHTAPHMASVFHRKAAASFIDLDADGDMALALTEFTGAAMVGFAAADLNKSGQVIFSEYETAIGKAIAAGQLIQPVQPVAPASPSIDVIW